MEKMKFEKKDINFLAEFNKLLKDKEYKEYIDSLDIPYEVLAKYTSLLELSKIEYFNCKNCKNILECKNKIDGCVYVPEYNKKTIDFFYKKFKYKKNIEKKLNYLKNVTTFNIPNYIKEASMKDIYKDDKNRFETIKYIVKFIDDYLEHKKVKGLYLYGNFGCGKTYLISAMINELAKNNVKSTIVFWPEFLRMLKTTFDTNGEFKNVFNSVLETEILLIDDIGAENITSWGRDEILCPILQYRMERDLPTFFTSNLDLKNLETHLSINKENIKARRIIERVMQLTNQIEMVSKNLRK